MVARFGLIGAVAVVMLCMSVGTAEAQPAGPTVTIAAPTIAKGGMVSFSGTVNVGNPVWTAGNPLVNIVQIPGGSAIPGVPGQVNVTQTGWSNASTTLPAGMYIATVTIKFTRAGQQVNNQTAMSMQFTVP